jgi:cytochrome c biogenesis protein CcmG/thiol:disulfide interchange protein DsbE
MLARILVLSLGCLLAVASDASMKIGKPAPEFRAKLVDGSEFELKAHRGDVVLINYWATWCEPCIAEFDAFKTYIAAHPNAKLAMIAVSMDDPEQRAKVDKLIAGLPFAIAMGADVDADGYGRIWRLPMSFIVDRDGKLAYDGGQGEQKPLDLPALNRLLDPLLQNE